MIDPKKTRNGKKEGERRKAEILENSFFFSFEGERNSGKFQKTRENSGNGFVFIFRGGLFPFLENFLFRRKEKFARSPYSSPTSYFCFP